MSVPVTRLPLKLTPDPRRVITRLFRPGDMKRVMKIVARVQAFPEAEVEQLLAQLERDFQDRHGDLRETFAEHYEQICQLVPSIPKPTPGSNALDRRLLHDGICPRVGRSLQSVDRPRHHAGRRPSRSRPISHELACHRRGAHLVDRVPHRHRSAPTARFSSMPPGPTASRSRRRLPTSSSSRRIGATWWR